MMMVMIESPPFCRGFAVQPVSILSPISSTIPCLSTEKGCAQFDPILTHLPSRSQSSNVAQWA